MATKRHICYLGVYSSFFLEKKCLEILSHWKEWRCGDNWMSFLPREIPDPACFTCRLVLSPSSQRLTKWAVILLVLYETYRLVPTACYCLWLGGSSPVQPHMLVSTSWVGCLARVPCVWSRIHLSCTCCCDRQFNWVSDEVMKP